MKLKVTESIFSNGTPHIQIVEGITLEDITVVSKTHSKDPEVVVTSDHSWDKKISISLKILPTDKLENQLSKYEVENGPRKIDLHEYVFNSPKYGENPKPIVSVDWSITPKFNGIKTKKAKIEKFNRELETFVSNFNQEEKMVKVLKDMNDRLVRAIEQFNKPYNTETARFFTNTETYSDQWDSYFQDNKDCKESIDEVKQLESELDIVKERLRVARQNSSKNKNKIVIEQLSKMEIEDNLKFEINEKLSDPNSTANKDCGSFDFF